MLRRSTTGRREKPHCVWCKGQTEKAGQNCPAFIFYQMVKT
jgi:hypothetical protein